MDPVVSERLSESGVSRKRLNNSGRHTQVVAFGLLTLICIWLFLPWTTNTNLTKQLIWWAGLVPLWAWLLLSGFSLRGELNAWRKEWKWILWLALLAAAWKGISWLRSVSWWEGMFEFLRGLGFVATFLLAMVLLKGRSARDTFMKLLRFAATMSCVYVMAQTAGWDFVRWQQQDRPPGTFGNPNFMAGFLVAWLPVVACWELKDWPRKTIPWGTALMLLALIATQARGPLVGFTAALILITLTFLWLAEQRGSKRLLVRGVLVVILLVELLIGIGFWFSPQRVRHILSTSTVRLRQELWLGTAELIVRKPLLGYGTGSYEILGQQLKPRLELIVSRGRPRHAHNWLLEKWVEEGVVGLGIFLLLLLAAGKGILTQLRATNHGELRLLLIGTLAGLAGFLIAMLFGVWFNWFGGGWTFWLLLGFAGSLSVSDSPLPGSRQKRVWSRLAGAMLLLAWLGLLIFEYHYLRASLDYELGKDLLRFRRTRQAVHHFEQAHQRLPWWGGAALQEARCRLSLGEFENARQRLDQLTQRFPLKAEVWETYGQLHTRVNNWQPAAQAFENAYRLEPTGAKLLDLLKVMEAQGELQPALLRAEKHLRRQLYLPMFYWYLKLQRRLGHSIEAREFLQHLSDRLPRWRPDKARAVLARWDAELSRHLQEWHKAKSSYLRALIYDPQNHQLWNDLAMTYWDMGRLEAAEEALQHALRFKPDEIPAHMNRLELAVVRGDRHAIAEELNFLEGQELSPRLRSRIDSIKRSMTEQSR